MYERDIVKKAFIKNNLLPIPVLKEPYFTDRLHLLEREYKAFSKWIQFQKEVAKFSTEQEFAEYNNDVRNSVISYIKELQEYQEFTKSDLRNVYPYPKVKGVKTTPYEIENIGKRCLSIDLKSGNYTALRFVNTRLVKDTKTYLEFITQFTDIEGIIHSKQLRQNIFGHLKNEHITYIEKYLTYQLLEVVMEYFEKDSVLALVKDEIVLDITTNEAKVDLDLLAKELFEKAKTLDIPIAIEQYELKGIYTIKDGQKVLYGYMKVFDDGQVEFKDIPPPYWPLILRAYYGEKVTESDKTFLYEGQIVRFAEETPISFE